MEKSKINYLIKEEIAYELVLRGVTFKPEDSVDLLRQKLRINFDESPNVANFSEKLVIKTELDTLRGKLGSLESSLENPDLSSPYVISRINAKFAHLSLRLKNLERCNNLKPEDKISVAKLLTNLNSLKTEHEDNVTKVSTISPEELTKFEDTLNRSLIEEEETLMNLISVNQTQLSPIKIDTQPIPQNESVQTANFTSQPPASSNEGFQLKNSEYSSKCSSSSLFNKLSNPVEKYLQTFPVTDGLEITNLLHFLRNLIKITTETSLTQFELYELLPNYCRGPLLNKVIMFKKSGLPISCLHQDILNTFVPITLLEKLKQDLIYRPQLNDEPVAGYISEIKINSQILKSHLSEKDTVTFIRNGLHPDVRNRLIFEQNPTSFADLDRLCINSNNVAYSDYVRNSMSSSSQMLRNNVSQSNNFRFKQPNPVVNARERTPNRENKNCFICNKAGHIARNCESKFRANVRENVPKN